MDSTLVGPDNIRIVLPFQIRPRPPRKNKLDLKINRADLQKKLETRFNLVCFIDIAELCKQHRTVFDIFKEHYKPEYSPNDRLVFYSSYSVEQSLLDHIQYAASRIDISNFFILFIGPHDLSDQLLISNKKYGNDDIKMQNLIVELEDTMPFGDMNFASRSFLCPMPFMAAQIRQDGSVMPCCKYQGTIGNINSQSIQDIFNNQEIDQVRQQMIAGKSPDGCKTCTILEKYGSVSFRKLMAKKHSDMLDQSLIDDPKIVDLTISPSSLCNFKCRICDAHASTSIRSELLSFAQTQEEKKQIKQIFKIHEDSKFDYIFSDTTTVAPEFLHILGGEPFLWPKLPLMIDKLIYNGKSKNICLEFSTNGSVYPTYFDRIIENFKKVEVLISIDAIGQQFEIQRGGDWETVLKNLKKFAGYNTSPTSIKLSPTVNIQNLLYLDNIVNLADQLRVDIVWTYLDTPSYLCIDNITAAVKQKVQELYKNHRVQELRDIAHRVTLSEPVSGEMFLSHIEKLDQRRNQDFSKFHQEICESMKYQL